MVTRNDCHGISNGEIRQMALLPLITAVYLFFLFMLPATAISESTFTIKNGVITGYSGNAETLVIPDTIDGQAVTGIGRSAFSRAKFVSVVLPEGLVKIEDYAFYGSSLRELIIPETVSTLGNHIVYNCKDLITVSLRGKNVAFTQSTFPAYREPDNPYISTERNIYYTAPTGSKTMKKLQEYGLLCAEAGGEIVLTHPLSRDPAHPTRVAALDGVVLDLSNVQNYQVLTLIDYYTRTDMPRNNGNWMRY